MENVSIVPADKVLGLPEVEIQFYSSFQFDSKKWTKSSVRTSELSEINLYNNFSLINNV